MGCWRLAPANFEHVRSFQEKPRSLIGRQHKRFRKHGGPAMASLNRSKKFLTGTCCGATMRSILTLLRAGVTKIVKPPAAGGKIRPRSIEAGKGSLLVTFNDNAQEQTAAPNVPLRYMKATGLHSRANRAVVKNACAGDRAVARCGGSVTDAVNTQMTDTNLDNLDMRIDVSVTRSQALHVSNLNIANAGGGAHHVAMRGRKDYKGSDLGASGVRSWGFVKQALGWGNAGAVSLSGRRLIPSNIERPMMEILAARVLVHDNSLQLYHERYVGDYCFHDPAPAIA